MITEMAASLTDDDLASMPREVLEVWSQEISTEMKQSRNSIEYAARLVQKGRVSSLLGVEMHVVDQSK